jgi:hypothetical protein
MLSCPDYPFSTVLRSDHPTLSRLPCQGYLTTAILPWVPCPDCPVPVVLSQSSCPSCVVLYQMSCPIFPFYAVMFWPSCPLFPILAVLTQLSPAAVFVLTFLSRLSYPDCPVPPLLSLALLFPPFLFLLSCSKLSVLSLTVLAAIFRHRCPATVVLASVSCPC